jgi:hypothetical protein
MLNRLITVLHFLNEAISIASRCLEMVDHLPWVFR